MSITTVAGQPVQPALGPPNADIGSEHQPVHLRYDLVLAAVAYMAIAALPFLEVWTHWSTQMNGCNCWDQVLYEWFLAWMPAALSHGHGLFVTNYLYAPGGINIFWNTSVPLLSVIATPLTRTLGVVHTMALMSTLAIALSSLAMYALLRRWVTWRPAAFLGGLVFGLSTYVQAEAYEGRLGLIWLPCIPLLVLVLDRSLRDRRRRPVVHGLAIGVLVAAQFLIGQEVGAIALGFMVLGLAVVVLARRGEIRERLGDMGQELAVAVVTFLVVAAYPLLVQFTGADRITGPPQTPAQLALFSQDLISPLVPGSGQWLTNGWANAVSDRFSAGSAGELTSYLGLSLVVFLVVTVVVLRRSLLVRMMAVVGGAAFLLSLGPRIIVDGHITWVRGSDAVLRHLPAAADVIPARFAIGTWFAAGALVALGLDALRRSLARARPPGVIGRRRFGWADGATSVVAALVLLPLLPAGPFTEHPADVPTFFTTADASVIPAGSLAATYPYAITATANGMLWQAEADMRFRLLGGYAIAPAATGTGTFFADPNYVEYCYLHIYQDATAPATVCSRTKIRSALHQLGVRTVVAQVGAPNVATVRHLMAATLGAPPILQGGVYRWACRPARASTCTWH